MKTVARNKAAGKAAERAMRAQLALAQLMKADGISPECIQMYTAVKGDYPDPGKMPAELPAKYIETLTKPQNWRKAIAQIRLLTKGGAYDPKVVKSAKAAAPGRNGLILDARDAEAAARMARLMMGFVEGETMPESAVEKACTQFERQAAALEEAAVNIIQMLTTGKAVKVGSTPWEMRVKELERLTTKDFAAWWLNKALCDLLDPRRSNLIDHLHQYPANSPREARGIVTRVNAAQAKRLRLKADGCLLQAYGSNHDR